MAFKLPDPERKLHEDFSDVAAATIPIGSQPRQPADSDYLIEWPAGSGQLRNLLKELNLADLRVTAVTRD